MSAGSGTIYGGDFYSSRDRRTRYSAEVIMKLVQGAIGIDSVIDVGCGTGVWLSVARQLGASRVVGIEGNWVSDGMLVDDQIDLRTWDLATPLALGEHFELAISLEVAEHLPPAAARVFIADLVSAAPRVLFSAAIPGQGGLGHINERWQSYWSSLFLDHDYHPVDLIRPAIWTDDAIPFYYRQNILLYLHRSVIGKFLRQAGSLNGMLDLVHPIQLRLVEQRALSTRESISVAAKLPITLCRAASRRLSMTIRRALITGN